MNRILSVLLVWGTVAAVSAQTLSIYSNTGVNPNPIMVDAKVFFNSGAFTIGQESTGVFSSGLLNPVMPYETQNTLFYQNLGVMSAIPGFNLEYIDDNGNHRPSSEILNGEGAVIQGQFANLAANITRQGYPNALFPLYGGLVTLNATNIINRGTIQGFYAGEIRLTGQKVDLSYGKVGSTPIDFSTFRTARYVPDPVSFQATASVVTPTSFAPETDVQDQWWRYGYAALDPSGFASEVAAAGKTNILVDTGRFYIDRTVRDNVTPESTDSPTTRLVLPNAKAFVWTNQPSATNKQIEIVFVSNDDTNVLVDVSWSNGPNQVDYPAKTAYVRFTAIQPDLVRQGSDTVATQFVVADTFGSQPLTQQLLNALTKNSQAPTNIFAFRAYPPTFNPPGSTGFKPVGAIKTNSGFSPKIFTHWTDKTITNGLAMTNQVTTNLYATWAGELVRLPSQAVNDITFIQTTELDGTTIYDLLAPTPIEGASITNLAGRVAINAKELDLTKARIQGQGVVAIKTDDLKSSRGAVIDAPVLDFDLASPNAPLVIRDFAKGSSSRFGGQFAVYSTTFTNSTETQIVEKDQSGADVTNTVSLVAIYHVTVVRNNLSTAQDKLVKDLILRAKDVDIEDSMYIDGNFYTTAKELNTRGTLLFGGIDDLNSANLPNLINWTNHGLLAVKSKMAIGFKGSVSDLPPVNLNPSMYWMSSLDEGELRARMLESFQNRGNLLAGSLWLGASQFEFLDGEIFSGAGSVFILADNFKCGVGTVGPLLNADPGAVISGALIHAKQADLSGLVVTNYNKLYLNVSDSLTGVGGRIDVRRGIQIDRLPAQSDLRNMSVSITIPANSIGTSFWPALDLGKSPVGFTNNLALGVLNLEVKTGGLVMFKGTGTTNALYVEKLSLGTNILATLTNGVTNGVVGDEGISLPEGFTLYFGSTSTNTTPAKLDGLVTPGGGKLVYLPLPGAPSGFVSVVNGDGRTVDVPNGVRFSTVLDSDGDGVPNNIDNSPFDVVAVGSVKLVGSTTREIEIQWDGAPGQAYEIQGTKDLVTSKWSSVKTLANPSAEKQRMTVRDPVDPADGFKAYRVILKF